MELERDGSSPAFAGELEVGRPHLYRTLLVEGGEVVQRGELARLGMIPDRPPEVEILAPEPWTELEPDRRELVVRAELEDDYGIGGAALFVTLAAGEGELVEFRERRFELRRRRPGPGSEERATARLDLAELGMSPGTELYLFVEATDRRRPAPGTGRSATHVVRMPGERTRVVELGAGVPVVPLPELFRSQRQIILDTERLVEESPGLTEAAIRRRSEAIGFDQRALRMRYGALLGEEFEEGLPAGETEEREDEAVEEAFAGATGGQTLAELVHELPAGFAHEHDSASIETFFDDRIKGLLKGALREMWGAEGRLRAVEPERALPFEYRALRLLKSAQEAERVYVQKVGYEPPPLDPVADRLSGELDEIESRASTAGARPPDDPLGARAALARLERWRGDRPEGAGTVPAGDDGGEALVASLEGVRQALVARHLASPRELDLEAIERPAAERRGDDELASDYRRRLAGGR